MPEKFQQPSDTFWRDQMTKTSLNKRKEKEKNNTFNESAFPIKLP